MTAQRSYSSMAAFLAHWRALRAARESRAALSPEETELLAGMERAIGALHPSERDSLIEDPAHIASATAGLHARQRREERAQRKLRPLLTSQGWLKE